MHIFLMRCVLFCLVVSGAGACLAQDSTGADRYPGQANIPSLISALKIDGQLDFCGELLPLAVQEVRERFEKEMLLILWDRPQVILWLKRAGRFFPYIENSLAENGLPDDLKYIAVVESSLLPHAGSKKGAVGLWQFMKGTARNYGLTINREIDERRNYMASTRAAIRYLSDLHGMFDSWTMAAAAYNMGEDRLKSTLEEQEVADYYKSYLSQETQRYLPRIIAVKQILADPARYGFQLAPEDLYQPLEFDPFVLTCPDKIPLNLVARAAGSYFKEIKELNPQFQGRFIPPGKHTIVIPRQLSADFETRYAVLLAEWQAENKKTTYIVRNGDSLSLIAERFKVPLSTLLNWNDLNLSDYIHPGERLIIYR